MASSKKRNSGVWIVVALVASAILAWALIPQGERIAPWMEYEYHEPLIDAPHLLQTGPYVAKVRVRRGLFWHTILDTKGRSSGAVVGRPAIFDDGHAALVSHDFYLYFYREGVERPIGMSGEKCERRYASHDKRTIVCLSFQSTRESSARKVASIHLDFYNSEGKVVDESTSTIPPELKEHFNKAWDTDLIGYDSAHRPVILSNNHSDPVERYICAAVVMDPAGMREVERKVYHEDVRCPRDAREWGVIRNGGTAAKLW